MRWFLDEDSWKKHLDDLGIKMPRHRQIATESALVGSVLSHGFHLDMKIISDDAGQFNIFRHGLCWLHSERKINALERIWKVMNELVRNNVFFHTQKDFFNALKGFFEVIWPFRSHEFVDRINDNFETINPANSKNIFKPVFST